jgi:hypothetical protein
MPPVSRRTALSLGASGVVASTAGCITRLSGRPKLSLTLLNRDDAFHRLYLQLHRTDRTEASEASVFDAEYELPARSEDGVAVAHDSNVVTTRQYLVRAGVDGEVGTHYHFYPDCTGNDEPEERLYVEIRPSDGAGPDDGVSLHFDQNGCGRDAWRI